MQRGSIKVFTHTAPYRPGLDVLICYASSEGQITATAEQLTFTELHDDGLIERATIDGPQGLAFLQAALDAAWIAGLRPTNWKNEPTEQVAAMDRHLQDMRRLVFGREPLALPDFLEMGQQAASGG